MTSKAATNPVAEGAAGIAQLREMGECDIPAESQKLNTQVSEFLKLDGEHEVIEKALGRGLFAGLRMNVHCRKNLHTRIAVRFEGDAKLTAITKELKDAEDKVVALQTQLREVAENAQKLLAERWDYSVKTFGLNPDKNFYRLLEEDGTIEEIELRCDKCNAGAAMVSARLEVEEYIAKLPKEGNDDGTRDSTTPEPSEGNAEDNGETGTQK